jgi:hypothetical protein
VNTHPVRNTPTAAESELVDVRVTWDPGGGWDVSVLQGGRVVASRHSDDWHHVERLRQSLPKTLRPALSRATATVAVVFALAAASALR